MRANLALRKRMPARPASGPWSRRTRYGHGLAHALRGFAAADGLALVEPENAVRLRELGWTKPVLLLEGFFDAAGPRSSVRRMRSTRVVHCDEQMAMLEHARCAARSMCT